MEKQQKELLDALKKLTDVESAFQSINSAKVELQRQLQARQARIEALEDEVQVKTIEYTLP